VDTRPARYPQGCAYETLAACLTVSRRVFAGQDVRHLSRQTLPNPRCSGAISQQRRFHSRSGTRQAAPSEVTCSQPPRSVSGSLALDSASPAAPRHCGSSVGSLQISAERRDARCQ
jgi:hypothetical protein